VSAGEDDFATLFEASLKAKQFRQGQTIEGVIVAIGPEVAFVDVGGKSEAAIEVAELKNDAGALEVKVGDVVRATVTSVSGGLTLSRRLTRGAVTDRQLENAYRAGLPVEGKVEGVVKGGYEVKIAGQRGFCPFSQIDVARTADPAVHVGRVYTFRIIEYKNDGKDLVVSRRALLEEEQQAKADEVRRAVVPGAVLRGRVVSVRDFGAFVDLGGGVQGLLHVSDMAWSRVASAAETVTVGDEITVKVLRVDEATGKIALGVKQLTEDPWSSVATSYEAGLIRNGRVTRVAEFGAFVELEPGIEALAHSSTFAPTAASGGWARSIAPGLTGSFEIFEVDAAKRRIAVALVNESARAGSAIDTGSQTIQPGARVTGKVERHEKFGTFVFLAPGRVGLMPHAESGVSREGDVVKAFPVGADVEVMVLEVDASGRRIRVSHKAVLEAKEAEELREYRQRSGQSGSGGLGSLGDRLRTRSSDQRD
jgi:small subunit ribosomal protein S1